MPIISYRKMSRPSKAKRKKQKPTIYKTYTEQGKPAQAGLV